MSTLFKQNVRDTVEKLQRDLGRARSYSGAEHSSLYGHDSRLDAMIDEARAAGSRYIDANAEILAYLRDRAETKQDT